MFSKKEYLLVFGGGMTTGIMYMICRLPAAIDDRVVYIVGSTLILMQLIPFFLYMALLVIHIEMLYLSKKFMDHSVEGDFKKTFQLLNYSEVITILSLFWILLLGVDFPTLYETWVKNPADAIKISFFPYWFYVTFLQFGGEINYQFSILWFFPLTIFSAIFEIYTYGKYYKARHRFTHMYPSVAEPDFYNAFISTRRKERRTMIVPEDPLEDIEVQPCESVSHSDSSKTDPYTPLGKNLGNNSLYVVDAELLSKRRNTFKTQAEIDAEEDGFFGGGEGTDNMTSFSPKRRASIDKKSQEYSRPKIPNETENIQSESVWTAKSESEEIPLDSEIPLDFDYQSFYRAKDTKKKDDEKAKKEKVTLIACPFCGTINPEDREECIFCGASLEKKKNRELTPRPFYGTVNPDGRGERII